MASLKRSSPPLFFAFIILIHQCSELAATDLSEQGEEKFKEQDRQTEFGNDGENQDGILRKSGAAKEQIESGITRENDDFQPRLAVRGMAFYSDDHESGDPRFIVNSGLYLSSGNDIDISNVNGVRIKVRSPTKQQAIKITANEAIINGRVVCSNIHQLPSQQTYQKTTDGAIWYTNLTVGAPMTPEEIRDFEAEEEKRRQEREARKERRRQEKEQRRIVKEEEKARSGEQKEMRRWEKQQRKEAERMEKQQRKEAERMQKQAYRREKQAAKERRRAEKFEREERERDRKAALKVLKTYSKMSEDSSEDDDEEFWFN